jgi:hypothetical protein
VLIVQAAAARWHQWRHAYTASSFASVSPNAFALQITTWEEAWPLLNLGGVYICEDMATSMVCRDCRLVLDA